MKIRNSRKLNSSRYVKGRGKLIFEELYNYLICSNTLTSTSASAPMVVGLLWDTSGEFSLLLLILFLRGGTGGASVEVGVLGGGGVVTDGGGGVVTGGGGGR